MENSRSRDIGFTKAALAAKKARSLLIKERTRVKIEKRRLLEGKKYYNKLECLRAPGRRGQVKSSF